MEAVFPKVINQRYDTLIAEHPRSHFSDNLKLHILLQLTSRLEGFQQMSVVLAKAFVLNFIDNGGFKGALEYTDLYRGDEMNDPRQLFVHIINNGRELEIRNEEIPVVGRTEKLFLGFAFALIRHATLCEQASSLAASGEIDKAKGFKRKAVLLKEFLLSKLKVSDDSILSIYNAVFRGELHPPEFILHDGIIDINARTFVSQSLSS